MRWAAKDSTSASMAGRHSDSNSSCFRKERQMDAITRSVIVYLLLLIIFRIAGKRTLSQITTFDLVLTLIISEAVQQALVDSDNSMTNAFLLVIALVGFDILVSLVKQRSPLIDRLIEGTPLVLVENGKLHHKYLQR